MKFLANGRSFFTLPALSVAKKVHIALKSKKPKILIPNSSYPFQVLNPRMFGTHSKKVMETQIVTDFTLEILKESIAV